MNVKILVGFLTLYTIYNIRNFYNRMKTQILFEQLWENIRITQETKSKLQFRRIFDLNSVIVD